MNKFKHTRSQNDMPCDAYLKCWLAIKCAKLRLQCPFTAELCRKQFRSLGSLPVSLNYFTSGKFFEGNNDGMILWDAVQCSVLGQFFLGGIIAILKPAKVIALIARHPCILAN